MTLPTADWNPLGSEFYRRIELGQMNWIDYGIDLNKFKIYAAPKGGNIGKEYRIQNSSLSISPSRSSSADRREWPTQ